MIYFGQQQPTTATPAGALVQNASEVYAGAFSVASTDGQTWSFQVDHMPSAVSK